MKKTETEEKTYTLDELTGELFVWHIFHPAGAEFSLCGNRDNGGPRTRYLGERNDKICAKCLMVRDQLVRMGHLR